MEACRADHRGVVLQISKLSTSTGSGDTLGMSRIPNAIRKSPESPKAHLKNSLAEKIAAIFHATFARLLVIAPALALSH